MTKVWAIVSIIALGIGVSGCGGSDSAAPVMEGGVALTEFTATLPDGSPMEIEILDNSSGVWAGEYAVATETGPYAHQVGSFEGTVSGTHLTATCENMDGTEFTLMGTANGNKSLLLTRSDIPGVTLNFQPVTPMSPSARADVTFTFNTGSSTGKMTLSTTPYSSQAAGTLYEYRGSWLGLPVTFWAYNSGYASVITYVDPLCINSANFANLRLTDLGSVTATTAGSQLTMYSTVIRAQVKFKGSCTVSP